MATQSKFDKHKFRSFYVKRKLDRGKRLLDNPIRMKQIQAYVRFAFDVFVSNDYSKQVW
jgi:hypothetical protein